MIDTRAAAETLAAARDFVASPIESRDVAHIVHLSDDLIFASRVAGVARDLGLDCATVRTAKALVTKLHGSVTCAIVDLANPDLNLDDLISGLPQQNRPKVVAYGSHVDAAGLRAARAAGCDIVLPRSQFVNDLPTELKEWAGIV